ncbi:MAG: DUF4368 domain-containing protein, partial [Oscillospiraceae bacterium]|nr:DUF4368 domain-containing protein [Oscillospiraceae bacterium]
AAKKLKKRFCGNTKSDAQKAVRDSKVIEKKIHDFDERFYQLYEDKLNGVISEDRFIELSRRCETEQNDLKIKLERIKSVSIASAEAEKNIESYISMIREFKNISELDKEIVHRLIDKIVVGKKYVCDGVKKQDITIYYKFIGEGV